jgi:hypothetical protein
MCFGDGTQDTAKVIQREFIAKTKDNFFSILTLGAATGNEDFRPVEQHTVAAAEDKLMELIAMGFDPQLASEALILANNNVERATEFLLQ